MKWVVANETYARSTMLARFDKLMEGRNVDYRTLMREAGLPPEALMNRNLFISHERYGAFLELVSDAAGEPDLGLRHALVLAPDFPNFGSLVQLARICSTLHEWIDRASRFAWLQTNGWTPALELLPDGMVRFRVMEGHLRRMPRQYAEGVMSTLFLLVRELIEDRQSTPARVCFRHATPADLSLHRKIFDCDLHFGCTENAFLFEGRHLEARINGRLAKFQAIFDHYIRAQIRDIVRRDVRIQTAVFVAICNVAGTKMCTAAGVAELLGMTEKKMQRLLCAENTSFRILQQEAMQKIATQLLAKTAMPVNEIARILGYGGGSAFGLAFSKSTGLSPTEYRELRRT